VEHHVPDTYVTQQVPETYISQHVPESYITQQVPETDVSQHEYVPVVENYGGALGHGIVKPSYGDHSDSGLLEYGMPHNSNPSVLYASASNEPDVPVLIASKAPTSSIAATSSAVISTKVLAPPPTPPVHATIGDRIPVTSTHAVHATPAVISTRGGSHYYNS